VDNEGSQGRMTVGGRK